MATSVVSFSGAWTQPQSVTAILIHSREVRFKLRETNGRTAPDFFQPSPFEQWGDKVDRFIRWLDEQVAVFEDEMRTRDNRPFFIHVAVRENLYTPVAQNPDVVEPLRHEVWVPVDLQAIAPELGGILQVSGDSDIYDIINAHVQTTTHNPGNPLARWARNAASRLPKP